MIKVAGDTASVGLILTTLFGLLPHIAAALAIIWWAMRIYQTRLETKKTLMELKRMEGKANGTPDPS